MLQQMPVTGAVVVTTPQDVALDNARKGVRTFDQHDTAVLGIVGNRSTFVCPDCGSARDIFDTDGGDYLAGKFDLPLLGQSPLDPTIRESGEVGEPIVLDEDTDACAAFGTLAENTMDGIGEIRRRSHRRVAKRTIDAQAGASNQ